MSKVADEVSASLAALFEQVALCIENAQRIAISGHTSPDGDALGSGLGLGLALRAAYPDKEISFLLADRAPVPRIYKFLPGSDELVPAALYSGAPDLFISVDCPILDRLNDAAELARSAKAVVAFDHHPARSEYAVPSIRVVESAATAVLVEQFLSYQQIAYSAESATCLMCGLMTDTGRFQYQNADPAAFRCAARLVSQGAEPALIALEVYQSQRLEYLKLEALVMDRIRICAQGRCAYSYATEQDLLRLGVSSDECDGLVDVVRSVQGVEVCLFVKELAGGTHVRGNLRSKRQVDISGVAAAFGGGGHAAAAGFTCEASIKDTLERALPLLVELVDGDPHEIRVEL